MSRLAIEPSFVAAFEQLGLRTCADVVRYFARYETIESDTVLVKPAVLSHADGTPVAVFYKQYEYAAGSWNYLWRRSKARCEFDHYAVFARLGIATADRIAWGEERDGIGRLRRAFIVTRAIPDALPLPQFLAEKTPDRKTRAELLQQLAAMTRRTHEARFFHRDLVARNVLVTRSESGQLKLWWIDCPRGGFAEFATRAGAIKDLASLDKSAVQNQFTRSERLQFFLLYRGVKCLDRQNKMLAREIQAYRQQRWPDDWK